LINEAHIEEISAIALFPEGIKSKISIWLLDMILLCGKTLICAAIGLLVPPDCLSYLFVLDLIGI